MTRIFLNYRRQDTQGIAGRIFDRLAAQYGADHVFMDVDTIPLGVDFRKHLQHEVGQCGVFLAVIGKSWLTATDGKGQRRLDSPKDFVRIEIETALARGIPVIPLLIGGAEMPEPDELPDVLQELVYRNALVVDIGRDFHSHVDRLIRGIEKIIAAAASAPPPVSPVPVSVKPISVPAALVVRQPPPLMKAPFSTDEARAGQEAWARFLGVNVVETNSIGMELTLIPPGEFLMGSSDADVAAALAADPEMKAEYMTHERPQHPVRLTQPFRMGTFPVTQGEFQRVMGHNPSHFSPKGDGKSLVERIDFLRLPVESVSWWEAVEYCNALSEREALSPYYQMDMTHSSTGHINGGTVTLLGGNGYRLPTEAEWEYACRSGTTTAFHFGDENDSTAANIDGNAAFGTESLGIYLERTSVVGSYPANGFGLHDMHGNVLEWCGDLYAEDFYAQTRGTAVNPIRAASGDNRVLRGGSWVINARMSRSASRLTYSPDDRDEDFGFRISRTL